MNTQAAGWEFGIDVAFCMKAYHAEKRDAEARDSGLLMIESQFRRKMRSGLAFEECAAWKTAAIAGLEAALSGRTPDEAPDLRSVILVALSRQATGSTPERRPSYTA